MRLANMSTFCASLYVGTTIDILDNLGFDTGFSDKTIIRINQISETAIIS